MKKTISALLIICMLLGSVLTPFCTSATHGYTMCDTDDNGDIDMKDVLLLRRYISGASSEKDICLAAADANGDGEIDMKDVLFISKVLAGIEDYEENNADKMYKIDSITVGNKNISRYTIVLTSDNACMKYAASELRNYIKDACGISLNISDDPSYASGYTITFRFDENSENGLGDEGYRVTVGEDGNMTIICGRTRGPLYAAYFILENLIGYRFLMDMTYLYEAENVNIPIGYDKKEVPGFEYRIPSQTGLTNTNFARLRSNAVEGPVYFVPDKENYGGFLGTLYIHAHSYQYQCNTEWYEQPCLTSEKTYQQIMKYNTELIEYRKSIGQYLGFNYSQISCSPNDNTNFCQCANCKKVYLEEGCVSGAVVRLANRVAESLDALYPGIEIFMISYSDSKKAPAVTAPRSNVCVCICNGSCGNHSYDHTEECLACGGNPRLVNYDMYGNRVITSNVADVEGFLSWAEVTDRIYAWYYSVNYAYDFAPAPNLFNIYKDLHFYYEHGVSGIYFEGSSATGSFELMKGYLASKVMWNPEMSEEEYSELMNEYLMIYYGEGWKYIREFIEMTDYASNLNGCWTNNFDRPWNIYNKDYFRDNYAKMDELFEKALAETDDTYCIRHLEKCRCHCDFLGLSATYTRDYLYGNSEARDEWYRKYKRLYLHVRNTNIKVTSLGYDSKGCQNFPKNADTVTCPMEWIWSGFSGYWD